MNDYREPLVPTVGELGTWRREYRITYRDNDTGSEYVVLADATTWMGQRRQLADAGFDVVVQEREVRVSDWRRL